MKLRNPQRTLFYTESRVYSAPLWRDGALIDYLGSSLRLQLDTDQCQAIREGDVLHLPLPPGATERQIQDAAESWLRREAELLFMRTIARETQRTGRDMPTLSLSFSSRGSWMQVEDHVLRINWRLIEQPLPMIDQALRRAMAMLPVKAAGADLFSAFAS